MERLREKFAQQQKQKELASKQNIESMREELTNDQAARSSSKYTNMQWKLHKATKLKQLIEADEKGIDLDRVKNSTYTLEQVNNWSEQQDYKHTVGQDPGFTDLNQLGCRKYQKLLDKLPTRPGTREDAAVRLSSEANASKCKKRAKYSKPQEEGEGDEDVTFINNRNMNFNKKAARFFNKFTQDIQASFERGTNI